MLHFLLHKLFLLFLKFILVDLIITKNPRKINNFYSEIFLVIKGNGNQKLLYNYFNILPSEVLVNGISKVNSCTKTCFLEGDENNITLIFNQEIKSCYNMFMNCENITYIDLSNFDASNVTNMESMFDSCSSLKRINFENINTSSLEHIEGLFYECIELTSIDLSNLNFSKVKDMGWMFFGCSNLEKINFGNIDTSSVESMRSFFYNCSKLTSINLSNFNTSKVQEMQWFFGYCINLEKIYFGNIDTSSVENIYSLFYNCSKLISLDLSNFNTFKVKDMGCMFAHCRNIKYLDLSNFDFSNINNIDHMFYNCLSLIFLNLITFHMDDALTKDKSFDYLSSYSKYCAIDEYTINYLTNINKEINCSHICFNKNTKIDIINNACIESCINNRYHYELNNICYHECPKDSYLKYCDTNECINQEVKECFDRTPEGYYLDINNKTYKKCFTNCKFCFGEGNDEFNNCKKCIDNYIFIKEKSYKTNCFKKCDKYYYFDENNEYKCIESCQGKYNKLIKEKNKCIFECKYDDTYKHEYNNTCHTYYEKLQLVKNENTDVMIKETIFSFIDEFLILNDTMNDTDIDIQDIIQEKIKDLIKYELNITEINDDIIINVGSVNYTITTTNNQKNNNNIILSKIDLGECENKLKDDYNISQNDSLYILKADLVIDQIHKVEYEVYYPFSPNNVTQLNLSNCEDIKIDISLPFDIPKGEICKYNKSSECYNSICYTTTSEDGTDEPYKDRQENYKKNNSLKVCEEDCDFNDYDINNKIALCSCFTKIKFPIISEIKLDEKKMYSNFKNIKNIANYKMLECIDLFFNIKNIIKNSSNYLMILLMVLSGISLFTFIFNNYLKIKNYINQLCENSNSEKKQKIINKNNNTKDKNKLSNKDNLIERKINITSNPKNVDKRMSVQLLNTQNKILPLPIENINNKNNLNNDNSNNKINKKNIIKYKKPRKTNIYKNKKNFNSVISKNRSTKTKIQLKSKEEMIDNKIMLDNEFNSLNYEEAKEKDKRSYCQYYFSLLRTKHILIFSFFSTRDYNSQSIKIYIFFFTFAINYTISSMFYSEETMHKINKDKGSFNVTYQLPIMFYSLIISALLKFLINNLGLYEEDILTFKNNKNKNLEKGEEVLYRIRCKIFFFFIITYILLFFFWIFLGCFCAVYKNTQMHLLIDVLSSFCL